MILEPASSGSLVVTGKGSIRAVFTNSAYAEILGHWICLLPLDGPDGAIHARLDLWPDFWVGQRIELRSGAVWQPSPWPRVDRKSLSQRRLGMPVEAMGDLAYWLGRGEGLTPSGDDRLCGYWMMRHALYGPEDWTALIELASERTHQISKAHLIAASQGLGNGWFHKCLCEFLDASNVEPDLALLDRIGHTSGREAFAGALAAIDEFLGR